MLTFVCCKTYAAMTGFSHFKIDTQLKIIPALGSPLHVSGMKVKQVKRVIPLF